MVASRNAKRRAGPEAIEIGRRIRARRIECGMSQSVLADQLDLTFQQVQKYEKGVNRVGAGRMQRMCDALNVPITYFYDADHRSRPASDRALHGTKLFDLLQRRDAFELATAFHKIRDRGLRRAVVKVVEHLRVAENPERR
jgi:transcriptional regulator with XRE-family HTH domain